MKLGTWGHECPKRGYVEIAADQCGMCGAVRRPYAEEVAGVTCQDSESTWGSMTIGPEIPKACGKVLRMLPHPLLSDSILLFCEHGMWKFNTRTQMFAFIPPGGLKIPVRKSFYAGASKVDGMGAEHQQGSYVRLRFRHWDRADVFVISEGEAELMVAEIQGLLSEPEPDAEPDAGEDDAEASARAQRMVEQHDLMQAVLKEDGHDRCEHEWIHDVADRAFRCSKCGALLQS